MTNEIDCRDQVRPQSTTLFAMINSGEPSRQTASRSHYCVTGSYLSSKMASTFRTESRGEEAAMLLADVLESVVAYRPQAVRVRFMHEGEACTAYPDIAVKCLDGAAELWEVKPQGKSSDRLVRRLRSLRLALARVGITYRIRQPHWSQRQPVHANALLVRRYASTNTVNIPAQDIIQCVPPEGTMLLGNLMAALRANLPEVLALAAKGNIALDIGATPLGERTPVRLALPGATSGCFTNPSPEEN